MVMELLEAGTRKLGIRLTERQIDRFEIFYKELVDWNSRFNLTRITDYDGIQVKHFLDSLTVVSVWQPRNDSVIDVGSGAGMPGLPLKIVYPEIKISLLEATGKKAEFLKYMIGLLELESIVVINGRAEELAHDPKYRGKFDIVLARAVGELATLVELTLPFCRTGGIFISSKKGDITEEIEQAQKAISLLGGKLIDNKKVELTEFNDERRLVVIEKIDDTPAKYPRRPGMPEKRPIK
jgi:16S rRNA (guanine527-N7)-methyltransferase